MGVAVTTLCFVDEEVSLGGGEGVNDRTSEQSSQEQTSTPLLVGQAYGWLPLSTALGYKARCPVSD